MKLALALAVLTISGASIAATKRNIYDLMYLPNAGVSFGVSDLTLAKTTVEARNNSADDSESSGYFLTQALGYTFTDQFVMQASFDYKNITSDPDNSSSTTSSGFSDLSIDGKYRVLDGNYIFDIIGGIELSRGKSVYKNNGDSDNLEGGHSANISAQVGQKNTDFQWAVGAGITHFFEQTWDYKTAGNIKIKPRNALVLVGEILNKFSTSSFLSSHVAASFDEGQQVKDGNDLGSVSIYELGTEYQHLISANLLLKAGVAYQITQTDTGNYEYLNSFLGTLGAKYQF